MWPDGTYFIITVDLAGEETLSFVFQKQNSPDREKKLHVGWYWAEFPEEPFLFSCSGMFSTHRPLFFFWPLSLPVVFPGSETALQQWFGKTASPWYIARFH